MAELVLEVKGKLERFKEDLRRAMKDVGKMDVGAPFKDTTKGIVGGVTGGQVGGGGGGVFGQMVGKLGLIGGILTVISEGIKRVGDFLGKASPMLKGTLDLFGRAMLIFFRPFGDFLAIWLRPMAIASIKMSVGFLRFMNALFPTLEEKRKAGEALAFGQIGPIIGLMMTELLKDFGQDVLNAFSGWLSKTIEGIGNFGRNVHEAFNKWLEDSLKKLFEFSEWLQKNIRTFLGGTFNLGQWLFNNLISFFTGFGSFNLGDWLQQTITGMLFGFRPANPTPFTVSPEWAELVEKNQVYSKFQVGNKFVAETGFALLHRGEQVIGATQKGGGGQLTVYNTFNFAGARFEKGIDVEDAIKSASRDMEIDLRRRGIAI